MKKTLSLFLVFILILSLSACSFGLLKKDKKDTENKDKNGIPHTAEGLPRDYLPLDFIFSSGAGGWYTSLRLSNNGMFSGEYSNSEFGDFADDYPYGTIYYCNFSGTFTNIERIDEFTYYMKLDELVLDDKIGKEHIESGVRYVAADAYGLEIGKEFFLYTPDTPVESLSAEFLNYWPYRFEKDVPETLNCYAIYNKTGEYGFFVYPD